jgi:hypothetical protein
MIRIKQTAYFLPVNLPLKAQIRAQLAYPAAPQAANPLVS